MKELGKTFIHSVVYGFIAAVSFMAGQKLWDEVLEDKVDDAKDYLTEKFSKN